jgi:hypothetical protein
MNMHASAHTRFNDAAYMYGLSQTGERVASYLAAAFADVRGVQLLPLRSGDRFGVKNRVRICVLAAQKTLTPAYIRAVTHCVQKSLGRERVEICVMNNETHYNIAARKAFGDTGALLRKPDPRVVRIKVS